MDSVGKLLAWINTLAEAGNLGYSDTNEMWLPGGRGNAREREGGTSQSNQEVDKVANLEELNQRNHEDGVDSGGFVSHHKTIFVEGELEKKSPAHNLWQVRWFKLATRQAEGAKIYTLMWFKKKDSSVLKSLSADAISGLILLSCARPIVYSKRDHCLHPSDLNNPLLVGANAVKATAGDASTYSFVIQSKAGAGGGGGGDKDITLRTDSAQRLMLWINSLAEAAGLEYCEELGAWQPGDRVSVVVANPKASVRIASLSVDSSPEEEIEKTSDLEGQGSMLDDDSHLLDHKLQKGDEFKDENNEQNFEVASDEREENTEMGKGAQELDCEIKDEVENQHLEHEERSSDQSNDDSEVDLQELHVQSGGVTVTSLDYDRRDVEEVKEASVVVETVSLKVTASACSDSDDENDDVAVNKSPLHSGTPPAEVTPPVFDMSSFERRESTDAPMPPMPDDEDVVEIEDGGSDEDIREYRMSDCDDDQRLKPAGCSGCVVM